MNFLEQFFSLEGQVAVVIGGTGVLCGKMAEGLAQAGATVVVAGRSPEKGEARVTAIEQLGGKAMFVATEVSCKDSLQALCQQVHDCYGRIDILVNGAGVNSAQPFLEIEEDELDRILDVNLKGVFRACQVFGAYFLQQEKPASIINLGSISGLGPLSRVFTYSATKAAVHNLSKNLAREWAAKQIRVNTLVPGFFPAEQNRKVLDETRVAQILAKTPAARFGEAEELLGATLLLASSKAGSFITGTELIVDGGFDAMSI